MSYTPAQAKQHIWATFLNTWRDPLAGWQGLVDDIGNPITLLDEPTIDTENDIDENMPGADTPFLSFQIRHYSSSPSTIGGETRKITSRRGFVLVRVWVPADTGLKMGDALSYVVKTAFERKRGFGAGFGIIFRAWRATEAGTQKNGSFLTVSTVDFEYDEFTGV
jgi:hypothetical protein